MFTKYARFESTAILDVRGSSGSLPREASLDKLSEFEDYRTTDGYLYARVRAISSRVNRNHDGWPSVELAGSSDVFARHVASEGGFTVEASKELPYGFSTFLGKPVYVDHNNHDPQRARGVIVDAKLHVEDARTASSLDPYYASSDVDPLHVPPTWVELLLEVDAKTFPKFAKALIEGAKDAGTGIDGFSMGCNVERTQCNICHKFASSPEDYCNHIKLKGATFDYTDSDTGRKTSRKAYENCFGVQFFELSGVFDPADETALVREVKHAMVPPASGQVRCPPCNGAGCEQCGGHGFLSPHTPGEDGAYAPDRFATPPFDPRIENQFQFGEQPNAMPRPQGKTAAGPLVQADNPYDNQLADALSDGPAGKECPQCQGAGRQRDLTDPRGVSDCPVCEGTGAWRADDGAVTPPESYIPRDPYVEDVMSNADSWNPPRHQGRTAAEQPLPQVDMTKAPQAVDSLRDEQICPICGSSMDDVTCAVCGYTQPPDGFDNPDLSQAQDQIGQEQPPGPIPPDPLAPRNPSPLAHVTHDMEWDITLHPKQAARINPVERPVLTNPSGATNEPRETIISDESKPVTTRVRAAELIAAAGANRRNTMEHTAEAASGAPSVAKPDVNVNVTEIGGVADASNEAASKADAQIDVTGVGGTGVESVSAEQEGVNVDQGNEHSKNIEEIPTKTFGDGSSAVTHQADPVTSDPFPASEDGVKRSYDESAFPSEDGGLAGGSAVKGTQPADPVGKAQDRVNLLEPLTSPANNSGPTKTWSGTDGNGVTKQQDPVTNETLVGDDGVKASKVYAAFKLADREIELGLTDAMLKYERVAALEQESLESIQAQLKFATRVKQAGLSKTQKTATRLPSFSRPAIAPREAAVESTDHTIEDSALFS